MMTHPKDKTQKKKQNESHVDCASVSHIHIHKVYFYILYIFFVYIVYIVVVLFAYESVIEGQQKT